MYWQSWNLHLFSHFCNVFAIGMLALLQGVVIAGSKSIVGYIFTSDEWVSDEHTFISATRKGNSVLVICFFYSPQKHCEHGLTEPHSLHISTVLWCTSGKLSHNKKVLFRIEYIELVSLNEHHLFVFVSIGVFFQCVCSGILVGAGMQKIAALSNLVCYYCVGLPVGIALMFAAKLRILGNGPISTLYVSANKLYKNMKKKCIIAVTLRQPFLEQCLRMAPLCLSWSSR